MAINLKKGQTINLNKDEYDLSKITIGLGWDVKQKEKKGGLLGSLFGGAKQEEYDLDAAALLLDKNGKIANLGRSARVQGREVHLVGSDIIFFNNLKHPEGFVYHTGDNLTGDGDGDDEQIIVMLNSLPERYDRVTFFATIYQGMAQNQHFGMVENAFIRAVDARGKEMARFNLSEGAEYNLMRTVIFAEVYRRNGEWKFRALGEPHPTDSLGDVLKNYVYAQ